MTQATGSRCTRRIDLCSFDSNWIHKQAFLNTFPFPSFPLKPLALARNKELWSPSSGFRRLSDTRPTGWLDEQQVPRRQMLESGYLSPYCILTNSTWQRPLGRLSRGCHRRIKPMSFSNSAEALAMCICFGFHSPAFTLMLG